jgi:cytochrome c oxidase assembly protein subunit 15
MRGNVFQRCALAALISVIVLIFVGAIVRVTGAGMGCPDWPTCWGCWVPPSKAADVDFSKLDIQKFQRKAERMGRDPQSITQETLQKEFNPRHVWTEYINRLFSLPVGVFSLMACVMSFGKRARIPVVFWSSLAALLLVLVNAWMGARVVYSGLAPGVLTLHMALAFLLIGVLTYTAWRGTEVPWRVEMDELANASKLRGILLLLLVLVVAEGVMGSQVREMTDEMSKHLSLPRESWNTNLENSWLYLVHRSFSWLILLLSVSAFFFARKHQRGSLGLPAQGVLAAVFAQMLLGLVMSQIHVYGWVQVLHVGLAAVLVACNLLWLLGLSRVAGDDPQLVYNLKKL